MKKIIVTSLIGLMTAGSLSAQVEILDEPYTATGVSNEGLVVLSFAWGAPYSMWNPETEDLYEIGGVSAGDGHGGMARFSADGKWVCGAAMSKMDWPEDTWIKNQKYQSDYIINDITFSDGITFYAVGQDTENNNKGVLMTSSDGQIWRDITEEGNMRPVTTAPLNSICFPLDNVGFMCGDNAYFAYSTTKGTQWTTMDPRPEGCTDKVKSYHTLDFLPTPPHAGVVGAELEDGGYAVYQTPDGAESWQATTGVTGMPVQVTHSGSTFWMVTKNGHIQKSIDNGLTWTDVYTTGEPLYKVEFSSDYNAGLALSEGIVYRTMDGGKNWEPKAIQPGVTDNAVWNDLLWQDAINAILIGQDGMCYYSSDRGTTWQKREIDGDNKDLRCIMQTDKYQVIGGVNGNFYSYIHTIPEVSMMARYNTKTKEWQTLGSLGAMSYPSAGSGYYISGDGNTIAGLAYTHNDTKTARIPHAAVWSATEGMIDLGGLFDDIGRATRANCVSYDGSVVVGWQDENGPWHSAVWRKNPSGGYYPNEFLLKDPSKGSTDIKNRIGQCCSVSLNGKWIGGRGQGSVTACENGWIWSEETGVIELPDLMEGYVESVNNDGTMATGFTGGMQGFIWTKEGGTKTLNEYVLEKFGLDLGDVYLMSALGISPNGRFLCGWAMEGQIVRAYRLDLQYGSSIESQAMEQCKASVYPNPASDELHVDVPFDMNMQIRLLDVQGRTILSKNTASQSNTLLLDGVAPGLYILDVAAEGAHKTFKIEVVR